MTVTILTGDARAKLAELAAPDDADARLRELEHVVSLESTGHCRISHEDRVWLLARCRALDAAIAILESLDEELQEENATLRADKARLDFLQQQHAPMEWGIQHGHWMVDMGAGYHAYLRAAIDGRMGQREIDASMQGEP